MANSGRAEGSCLSWSRAVSLTQPGSLPQQRDHDGGVAAADGSVQRPHAAVVHVLNHCSFLHQILHLGEEMKHALEHGFWCQRQTKEIFKVPCNLLWNTLSICCWAEHSHLKPPKAAQAGWRGAAVLSQNHYLLQCHQQWSCKGRGTKSPAHGQATCHSSSWNTPCVCKLQKHRCEWVWEAACAALSSSLLTSGICPQCTQSWVCPSSSYTSSWGILSTKASTDQDPEKGPLWICSIILGFYLSRKCFPEQTFSLQSRWEQCNPLGYFLKFPILVGNIFYKS